MSNRRLIGQIRNKKILITGGEGFLGKHLFTQLNQICRKVSLYQGDVRDIASFRRPYDIVCHLAAANKIDSRENINLLFDVNVNGTLAVMYYCLRYAAKCIFASSSAVYKPATYRKRLNENSCIRPVSLYGVSKMLAESICRYHAENFGIPVIALRIFNMYGPYQKEPFLIPYAINRLSKNKYVLLKEPQAQRDFVYVTDVAKAFALSCANKQNGFIALNVGTSQPLSVHKVVQKIAKKIGIKARICNELTKGSNNDCVVANTNAISKFINWHPLVSFDKGLTLLLKMDIKTSVF